MSMTSYQTVYKIHNYKLDQATPLFHKCRRKNTQMTTGVWIIMGIKIPTVPSLWRSTRKFLLHDYHHTGRWGVRGTLNCSVVSRGLEGKGQHVTSFPVAHTSLSRALPIAVPQLTRLSERRWFRTSNIEPLFVLLPIPFCTDTQSDGNPHVTP
jgi:hypothetical protein